MPKSWNGNLVVFAMAAPPSCRRRDHEPERLAQVRYLVKSGYGWVASSYRSEGYGVRMAAEDSDHARRFFVERIGKPRRTIMLWSILRRPGEHKKCSSSTRRAPRQREL